jgi:RNA polymerase sigma factor for flagellar operon FliA
MPRSLRKSQRTIDQAIRTVEQREQRSATEREVADVLGVSLDEYQRMLGEARGAQLVYLDDVGGDDGEEGFVERNLADDSPTPLDRLQDSRFRSALVASIKELPEREALVMSLYYEQDLNLKEIGVVLGVTESRVSQIHSQAVARIRSRLTDWL